MHEVLCYVELSRLSGASRKLLEESKAQLVSSSNTSLHHLTSQPKNLTDVNINTFLHVHTHNVHVYVLLNRLQLMKVHVAQRFSMPNLVQH